MGEQQTLPWIFALVTCMWFGVMAWRAERNWFMWALGGALYALPASTIILGVSQAAFMAISPDAVAHFRGTTLTGTAAFVGVVGWLLTLGLQRWPRRLWGRTQQNQGPAAEPKKSESAAKSIVASSTTGRG
jgi:hypothetical protein